MFPIPIIDLGGEMVRPQFTGDIGDFALSLMSRTGRQQHGDVMMRRKAVRLPSDATEPPRISRRDGRQEREIVGFRQPAAAASDPTEGHDVRI